MMGRLSIVPAVSACVPDEVARLRVGSRAAIVVIHAKRSAAAAILAPLSSLLSGLETPDYIGVPQPSAPRNLRHGVGVLALEPELHVLACLDVSEYALADLERHRHGRPIPGIDSVVSNGYGALGGIASLHHAGRGSDFLGSRAVARRHLFVLRGGHLTMTGILRERRAADAERSHRAHRDNSETLHVATPEM